MTTLDTLAGTARGGTLYGIGVGPGDVRYLTIRAAGLVCAVDVVAYFAKRGNHGNARRIVEPLMAPGRAELRLEYPVTDEIPAESADYRRQIGEFYRQISATLAGLLREGKSVGLLAEGGMSGCWTRANLPITWGDDTLVILPGTLGEAQLADRLRQTDAAVIMKVGRNLGKVRRAVEAAGLLSRAVYVERGTMENERILPLAECHDTAGTYFAMVLIAGQGRRI